MATLSHPNVITVYDVGTEGEDIFSRWSSFAASTYGAGSR